MGDVAYVYGIRYFEDEQVSWYDYQRDAVSEFNARGDKYADAQLVRGHVTWVEVLHPGVVPGSQFDNHYETFYYREPEDG